MKAEAFLYGAPSAEQKQFLADVLGLGLEFAQGSLRGGHVLQYAGNAELAERFEEHLPHAGASLPELLENLREIASYSIAQADPRYLSFPDTGNSVAGIAADIVGAFLNQNLIAVDRSAPAATFIEVQLLLWLRQIIGYSSTTLSEVHTLEQVGGMWTPGGNMSNHIAVLVALQDRFPTVRKTGLRGLSKRPVIILARGIEHFSFAGAAAALGLGSDSLLWVKASREYRTDVEAVEAGIVECPEDAVPFMVVSVAGNCRTTGIDDVQQIGSVCERYGLWHHVDACHGGSLLFSKRLRVGLAGIGESDSVSLDPHKGLFVTYPSSYVLFRDPTRLSALCRYPGRVKDPNCLDLGLLTPFFGSRGFQSLKLWLLIKHLGVGGIGEAVEARAEVNERFAQKLEATGLFCLLNRSDFYRVAFVFLPNRIRRRVLEWTLSLDARIALRSMVSRYTERFCQALYESGEVVFDQFTLQDLADRVGLGTENYTAMAMAIGHPVIEAPVEDAIFESVSNIGRRLELEMEQELETFDGAASPEGTRLGSPASW